MQIEAATNNDIPKIKALVFEVLNEYGLKPSPCSTDSDLDNIESKYFSNHGYFGIVKDNQSIIATVGIFHINHKTCELRKMYIATKFRGKGLGKYLLDFAINKAKELDYEEIVLETATPLKEAISLYRKYGFEEYPADHLASRCDQAFKKLL